MTTDTYQLNWIRSADYRISRAWVKVADGAGGETLQPSGPVVIHAIAGGRTDYDPFAVQGLIPELVKVGQAWKLRPRTAPALDEDPIVTAALRFAQSFGLLGQTQLGSSRHTIIEGEEPQHPGRPRRYVIEGDELAWFVAHADNVNLALTLIDAIRRNKWETLGEVVWMLAVRQDLDDPAKAAQIAALQTELEELKGKDEGAIDAEATDDVHADELAKLEREKRAGLARREVGAELERVNAELQRHQRLRATRLEELEQAGRSRSRDDRRRETVRTKWARGMLKLLTSSNRSRSIGLRWQVPTVTPDWWHPMRVNVADLLRAGENVKDAARKLLAELLTPNLAAVERVFDPKTGRPAFRFRALVQAIYWTIADREAGSLARCAECGAWFFQDDDRERFCPPPPGVRESRCGRRFRMRALREKTRQRS